MTTVLMEVTCEDGSIIVLEEIVENTDKIDDVASSKTPQRALESSSSLRSQVEPADTSLEPETSIVDESMSIKEKNTTATEKSAITMQTDVACTEKNIAVIEKSTVTSEKITENNENEVTAEKRAILNEKIPILIEKDTNLTQKSTVTNECSNILEKTSNLTEKNSNLIEKSFNLNEESSNLTEESSNLTKKTSNLTDESSVSKEKVLDSTEKGKISIGKSAENTKSKSEYLNLSTSETPILANFLKTGQKALDSPDDGILDLCGEDDDSLEKEKPQDQNQEIVITNFDMNDPRYKCPECDKRFFRTDFLREHLMKHFPKVHVCTFCKAHIEGYQNLCNHMEVIHAKYECDICKKKFVTPIFLRFHKIKKCFKCYKCNVPFKSLTNLKDHLQIHMNFFFPPPNYIHRYLIARKKIDVACNASA